MKQNMKNAIGLSLKRYNETYMKATNDRIDNIVSQAGTDNTEIVDARIDSAGVTHTTLNNRILAETKMNDQHLVSCSGEYITAENTMGGSITNLEVLGNTIQNEEDLADIKSVGELQEDGTYKMSILSCGKNLLNINTLARRSYIQSSNGDVTPVGDNTNSATSEFIKVNPNSSYIISFENPRGVFFGEYDCNRKFIKKSSQVSKLITSENTRYIRVQIGFTTSDEVQNIQLEEGTVATSYEPYQGNKCDILLPCQLEKVGTVSDRLFRREDGVWCVEKNIKTTPLKDLPSINNVDLHNDTHYVVAFAKQTILTPYKNVDVVSDVFVCKTFSQGYYGEPYKRTIVYTNAELYIFIPKEEFSTFPSITEFKDKVLKYQAKLMYNDYNKTIIELPLDIQIQLNSFNGVTNIFTENTIIEPTIKCKIPKSLGATVQSLNNKTDILSDRIEAIEGLKDSQNMKYETDKGYLVCKETKNGVIDDLKIEGRTLVNKLILSNKSVTTVDFGYQIDLFLSKNITPKGVYYVTNYNDKRVRININRGDGTGWIETMNFDANSTKKINVDVDFFVANIQGLSSDGWNDSNKDSLCKSLIITETIQETGYFEGLMSVGQDVDEIEVLSVNSKQNLIDFKPISTVASSTRTKAYRTNIPKGTTTLYYKIILSDGTELTNNGNLEIQFRDKDDKTVVYKNTLTPTKWSFNKNQLDNCKSIGFYYNSDFGVKTISKFILSTQPIVEDLEFQEDKKQILFYNENGELKPIQELHEWDSIEKHSDNKWYYHKRSGEVVLNGSESWRLYSDPNSIECIPFEYVVNDKYNNPSIKASNLINDKFKVMDADTVYAQDVEGIVDRLNLIRIKIQRSKLSTQDVQGFKQWLQTNNVTVVYQLAQEEVYELAPLHLDSYANETLILCNSGAISPKMEFSITSHINELVKAYGERVNLLEEKVYQYMVTQNRMQLASTYSADSVTFKVDYFSLCGDEENYDEDLYNLILNNILVGKDNYDYDKMFTMILDYASWNQISWEQFDILVGLMDMQHNPPIEELPPEDVIEEDIIENETPVE